MPKYRIGIDVGGTFTHAVALNNDTYELAGQAKVQTTHTAREGVAKGIIEALNELIRSVPLDPQDVIFIAHSTTQATNALLEGDVACVGIVAMGRGLEGKRVRSETDVGDIALGEGKGIRVLHSYIDIGSLTDENIRKEILRLQEKGALSIVASEAFSVDDPSNEERIKNIAIGLGLPATGTYEISGLYGLRIRTRTAAVNASILPKMIEAALATEKCVKETGIKAPLMIMRSDGGVMSIDQMKKRPILTILSGPAAGIASALLYAKISDGIFLEVGGTSTDIAVIRNGKAVVRSAEIGGRKLFLRTLDSRTVGIAGGSLPVFNGGKLSDVGPRSAHIAGLKYSCFCDYIVGAGLKPALTEDGYFSIEGGITVTTTCAANYLGLVKLGDWAYGDKKKAEAALRRLGDPKAVAGEIMKKASDKVVKVIKQLIRDYKIEKQQSVLIGGGGGAAAIVPFTASAMGLPFRIAQNHAVISAIGAALAMVTDTIERSCQSPTEDDIARIRKDAESSVSAMGAAPGSVEVSVEVDRQKNILRATACGTTELRNKDLLIRMPSKEEKLSAAAASLGVDPSAVSPVFEGDHHTVWAASCEKKYLFGLMCSRTRPVRVMDREGLIRLAKNNAAVRESRVGVVSADLARFVEEHTTFGDAGARMPQTYVLAGHRIIDLSGMPDPGKMAALLKMETSGMRDDEKAVIILGL